MLPKLIFDKMKRDNLSVRDAAKQIGVAHTTVHRILNGKPADVDTLYLLSQWLGVSPSVIIDTGSYNRSEALVATALSLIKSRPELASVFEDVARGVLSGELSVNDAQDIVAYAAYKLRTGERRNE